MSKHGESVTWCYLPFCRLRGALYRRLICAAFSCKTFRPFFLGLHIWQIHIPEEGEKEEELNVIVDVTKHECESAQQEKR